MAKEKDLNDAAQEAASTGSLPKLRLVDEEFDLAMGPNYLEIMNEKHAFINTIGGKPMVMCNVYNEVFNKEIYEFRSPDAIMMQYCNQNVEGGKKGDTPIPLGKWWISHIDRREYETITFEPARPPGEYTHSKIGKKYFNMWEGFTVEPAQGSWRRTLKHLYKVLCNSDRDKFNYVIRWLAWAVQNPGTRAEVALVFKGKKGAGKGFIFTQLVKLFGRHGMSISNSEHLVGKHNAHLMNLSFLFADEAYYPGDKDVEGALKQLITEPYLTVEPKFQNTKLSQNCLHIGMSTNNEWVIPASEDERRYFINAVDNSFAMNQTTFNRRKKYFSELWGEMENGGRAAMLYDLLNMDLGEWHPRDNIPLTEELQLQRDLSLPRREKAIVALFDNGIFPGKRTGLDRFVVNSTVLNDFMEKIDPGSIKVTMRNKAMIFKELGIIGDRIDGERVWIFPSLIYLKKAWNKLKGNYGWEDYNEWELQRQQPIDTI